MMAIELVSVLLVCLFMMSAAGKMSNIPDFQRALIDLNLSRRAARVLAIAVPSYEILFAFETSLAPSSPAASVVLASLAFGFAGAGLFALRSRRVIRCMCFGGDEAALGWRQLVQLPILLAFAVMLWRRSHLEGHWYPQMLPVAAVTLTGIKTFAVARAWDSARDDRRSIEGGREPAQGRYA